MKFTERQMAALCAWALAACAGEAGLPPAAQTTPTKVEVIKGAEQPAAAVKQAPPTGGQPREIHFPPIARETTGSGLEVNTVALHGVPVGLKDLCATAGVKTTGGSKILRDSVPELRVIAARLIPYTYEWNARARSWRVTIAN